MTKLEATETAPKPIRVTDPFIILTGKITYHPLAHKVTHQPVTLNHQELDASVQAVNPLFGRAVRTSIGLKKGDFECSGSDSRNTVWDNGSKALCGGCLLEVSDVDN
jgi:hypothetical protein